ncbi:unnamed protein product [Diabrotica balteata]|uniref:NAD(P)-binding domain-containing protein n=1 Tax=Diabrotica balteata TaxID=107213 RepID=A0A9N9T702_DIABA|nr:unnamed protein product [Diabrotica balteata]
MAKIIIFGCTGMTGLCAVEAAVNKGLSVKAFVRNPARLPEHLKNSVEVVTGNVLDYKSVLDGIKDVSGVVVALGTNNDLSATTDLSTGLQNIIKAMKELNVEKISVCLSAFLFYEVSKVPPRFKDLNDEHQRMYDVLKASGLKYIAVFPPHIADEPLGEYVTKQDAVPGARVISKRSLGAFLVDSLDQPEHYGKTVGISNKTQ